MKAQNGKQNDLTTRVSEWLATEGYPLEMRVARAFLTSGFRVLQSEYYEDPETKIPREIDVVAEAQLEFGGNLCRLTLCVECKVAKDKPWVLLTSPHNQLSPAGRVAQRAGSLLGRRFLSFVARNRHFQELQLLALPRRPAYGVLQAFAKGNDSAYAACVWAAKAAAAEVKQADAATVMPILEIVVPVVIVDGRLFECFLNQNGDPEVTEVVEGTLVWRNPLVRSPHTIIRIATISHLPVLVQQAVAAADLLLKNSEDELERFFTAKRVVLQDGRGEGVQS